MRQRVLQILLQHPTHSLRLVSSRVAALGAQVSGVSSGAASDSDSDSEPHSGHLLASGASVRVDGREGAEDRVQPLQQHHGPVPEDQRRLHPGGRPDEVRAAAGLQTHGGQL